MPDLIQDLIHGQTHGQTHEQTQVRTQDQSLVQVRVLSAQLAKKVISAADPRAVKRRGLALKIRAPLVTSLAGRIAVPLAALLAPLARAPEKKKVVLKEPKIRALLRPKGPIAFQAEGQVKILLPGSRLPGRSPAPQMASHG